MLYSIVWGKGRPCAGLFLFADSLLELLLFCRAFAAERCSRLIVGFLARQLLL
jgi:hypothetical protein